MKRIIMAVVACVIFFSVGFGCFHFIHSRQAKNATKQAMNTGEQSMNTDEEGLIANEQEADADGQETDAEDLNDGEQETDAEDLNDVEEKTDAEDLNDVEQETYTDEQDTISGTQGQNSLQKADQEVPMSDLVVCLDPGHYRGASSVEGENSYGYTEDSAMLALGKRLQQILKESYGITSYLTRENEDISIGGYTNGELDHSHISLRGEAAKGANFFVSLHSNANNENANGYPTENQPLSINKPLILANQIVINSEKYLQICNELGRRLTEVYKEEGLIIADHFDAVSVGGVPEWTMEYNDSLGVAGTVLQRKGEKGDYYGVLRGSANVGIPGIIIEHGYHTTEKIRKAAIEGDLIEQWAQADAAGIALLLEK